MGGRRSFEDPVPARPKAWSQRAIRCQNQVNRLAYSPALPLSRVMPKRPAEILAEAVNSLGELLACEKEAGSRGIVMTRETFDELAKLPPGQADLKPAPGALTRAATTSAPEPRPAKAPASPTPPSTEDSMKASSKLDAIAARIAACETCGLCSTRTNTVPGQGAPHPELVFVGEGPGEQEDLQGLAFVGRSGQLLTRMIGAMGLDRETVWIGNIVKCRPPKNRTPTPEEMEACIPFLKEQLGLLKPKVIVCLGATAAKGLLGQTPGISKIRGTWHKFEGIDVMPTYHPSYLLRNAPGAKRQAWEDLKKVVTRLGRELPPESKGK